MKAELPILRTFGAEIDSNAAQFSKHLSDMFTMESREIFWRLRMFSNAPPPHSQSFGSTNSLTEGQSINIEPFRIDVKLGVLIFTSDEQFRASYPLHITKLGNSSLMRLGRSLNAPFLTTRTFGRLILSGPPYPPHMRY